MPQVVKSEHAMQAQPCSIYSAANGPTVEKRRAKLAPSEREGHKEDSHTPMKW